MDRDEATKRIRAAAEAGQIEFAPTDGVESFEPLTSEFMPRSSCGGAMVTDPEVDQFTRDIEEIGLYTTRSGIDVEVVLEADESERGYSINLRLPSRTQ